MWADKRTYYYDRKRDDYVYLIDKAVGLEGYERITGTVAGRVNRTCK
ncbi:UPF0236 family transposase-like protein [Thermincola ferriacetica]